MKIPPLFLPPYEAVIKCLENLHPEARAYEVAFRETGHGYRTPHYSNALKILTSLIRYDLEFQSSIFVSDWLLRWLKSYPFGGYNTIQDKKEAIDQLLSLDFYHPSM